MRLKTSATEIWLTFSDGSAVLARPIPMSKANEILRQHTTYEQVRGVGQVERRDFAEINRDTYRYKIISWRGMLDDAGNDFPFNAKNLDAIIEYDQAFLDEVDAKLDATVKARGVKAEELEKN